MLAPPIVVELIPGRLHATVYSHEVSVGGAAVPCRTCASHGMAAAGRPEVALTRVAAARDDLDVGDAEVLNLFARLLAAPPVRVGGVTRFDVAFLGARGPNAVTWVEAAPFPGVALDDGALAAVVLQPDEAPVAETYGPARVLARLGRQARYHPFPRWWDAARASVAHPDDAAASALAGVTRIALPEATLAAVDRTVVVRLPVATRDGLAAALAGLRPDAPCALLIAPEALTDACLVWAPGQEGLAATSSSGRRERMGGNFVLFAPGHPRDQGAPLEDGFALRLRAETWRALRGALRHGRGVILDAGDEANHGLRVEWVPAGAPAEESAAVRLARVVLLQPEESVARAVSSRDLSRYLAALRGAAAGLLGADVGAAACDVQLQVDLDPRRRPAVSLGVRPPSPRPPSLDGLLARVSALPAPAVRGPVGLRLLFAVRGGSGEPLG